MEHKNVGDVVESRYTVVFACPAGHRWEQPDWPVIHHVEKPGDFDRLTYGHPAVDRCPECHEDAVSGDYDNGNPVGVVPREG
jgi:hypothetical protein